MKDFVTAVKDSEQEFGFDVDFTIDKGTDNERQMVAHKPSGGQITMFLALAGDDLAANHHVIAQSINFLNSLLDPEDQRYLRKRLFDREDDFGAEEVADILSYVLEEWSGKDGGSRTVSRNSRRSAGRSSTARQSKTA